jgi:hypothetical protein
MKASFLALSLCISLHAVASPIEQDIHNPHYWIDAPQKFNRADNPYVILQTSVEQKLNIVPSMNEQFKLDIYSTPKPIFAPGSDLKSERFFRKAEQDAAANP